MKLNLIWTQDPRSLSEAEWIRWLMRNFEMTEQVAPKLDVFKDKSVYILSSNHHPLVQLQRGFLEGLKRVRAKGLFHLSDESYSGGYEVYSNFDFVLRNYHSTLFDNRGIMTLPLGPTGYAMNGVEVPLIGERKFVWSFAGAKTAARLEMFREFRHIEPHQCYFFESRKHQKPVLDQKAFLSLLSETMFAPCPMGNVVLESFRLYECLEMGCIPIVERRRWMPYYDQLLLGHPLPSFSSWHDAREFVEAVSRDRSKMAEHQRSIQDWWQKYKAHLRTEIASFVTRGLEGSFAPCLTAEWHCRSGVRHQIWRLFELCKHATLASLEERISTTLDRMIHRALFAGRAAN